MSSMLLTKYRDLRPINDEQKTLDILKEIAEMPADQAKAYFTQSQLGGGVYLYGSDRHPGFVVEYVPGHRSDDSVSTLYANCSHVADKQTLLAVREELIAEIASFMMALPSTIGFFDQGRQRHTVLNEMGAAQLIDALADVTHTDLHTV